MDVQKRNVREIANFHHIWQKVGEEREKKIEKNRTKGKRAIVFFYGVLFIG